MFLLCNSRQDYNLTAGGLPQETEMGRTPDAFPLWQAAVEKPDAEREP